MNTYDYENAINEKNISMSNKIDKNDDDTNLISYTDTNITEQSNDKLKTNFEELLNFLKNDIDSAKIKTKEALKKMDTESKNNTNISDMLSN